MLLYLLQYVIRLPLLLFQGLLRIQVLLTVVFFVVLDVIVAPSSILIVVAKVDSLPQLGATLLTVHGCGTCPAPFWYPLQSTGQCLDTFPIHIGPSSFLFFVQTDTFSMVVSFVDSSICIARS